MPKKFEISQSDINAFREAVKDVKPLTHNKIQLKTPRPLSLSQKQKEQPTIKEPTFRFSEFERLPKVHGDEFISYKQIGISNKILRKLRKGQYNVEVILDLHGMTIDEAISSVDDFIQQCLHDNIRIGLIIHGKGVKDTPILKNKLNHWLRETNVILAFCSAAPHHGGRGALYVLFKHVIKEKGFE